jgi:hypothetical protein
MAPFWKVSTHPLGMLVQSSADVGAPITPAGPPRAAYLAWIGDRAAPDGDDEGAAVAVEVAVGVGVGGAVAVAAVGVGDAVNELDGAGDGDVVAVGVPGVGVGAVAGARAIAGPAPNADAARASPAARACKRLIKFSSPSKPWRRRPPRLVCP